MLGSPSGSNAESCWQLPPAEIPAQTPESVAMSKDLLKHGFRFVGPTICYAYMQATGMVNDHVTGCFRYKECKALGKKGS